MDHDDGHVRLKPDPADRERERDRDRWGLPPAGATKGPNTAGAIYANGSNGGGAASSAHASSRPQQPPPQPRTPEHPGGYTLMVAGQRSGKTSFLRLLLDTSTIAASATEAQLASVARFVAGCAGHTSHIRTAAVDIAPDALARGPERGGPITLTLVDTPSLDFTDEDGADRMVSQIIQHVESRFAESLDDEAKAAAGDHHVHICLYFLDPDAIVPPSPSGSAPLAPVARSRGNSVSQIAPSSLVLEPPVPTNPALCRPTLPAAEVAAIRRLSVRVNVLPVVARADTLTNDRLAAVKLAIRRDLAEAGIGFGIFDTDIAVPALSQQQHDNEPGHRSPQAAPPSLQLPYALISPEMYSHSDGVARTQLARHELVQQYTPSRSPGASRTKLVRGRFTRSFRWGSLDVLDPRHSDFVALRASVFHHMDTLHKYTREYLFEKFRAELHHAQLARPTSARRDSAGGGGSGFPHSLSLSPEQRIIHPDARTHRPSLSVATPPNGMGLDRDGALVSAGDRDHHRRLSSASSRSHKHQRSKKITVACNFCRSRKLKCDGGRPACSQCVKRSVPCDYIPHIKRRGPGKYKVNGDDSDDGSGEEDESSDERDERDAPDTARDYADLDRERWERHDRERRDAEADYAARARYPEHSAVSRSPEVDMRYARQQQLGLRPLDVPTPPGPPSSGAVSPYQAMREREELAMFGARSRANTSSTTSSNGAPDIPSHLLARPNGDNRGALGLTGANGLGYMGPQLPPIQPLGESRPTTGAGMNGDGEANGRKRAASQSQNGFVKPPRAAPSAGSKVVACNFCRARKTKCDSAHPTCSSCARRNLPCSYVNDPNTRSGGPGARKNSSASAANASTSSSTAADSGSAPSSAPATQPPSTSSTTSSASPPPQQRLSGAYMLSRGHEHDKRMDLDEPMLPSPAKRLRLDGGYDTGGGGGAPPGLMPMTVSS